MFSAKHSKSISTMSSDQNLSIERTHAITSVAINAFMDCLSLRMGLLKKIEFVNQRLWNYSKSPFEFKEYIPAAPTFYPDQANFHNRSHIVLFDPSGSGYQLIHSAGFVKLNLKVAHEGAFNIVMSRTQNNNPVFRLTFVENGMIKKIEPIFYRENGLSIEMEVADKTLIKPRPMIFPTWEKLLKQLGNVVKHLLYISIPKDLLVMDVYSKLTKWYDAPFENKKVMNTPHIHLLGFANPDDKKVSGSITDRENMENVFSKMVSHFGHSHTTSKFLLSPNLREMIDEMTSIYVNAQQGDYVLFYYSGYGRQIFRSKPSQEPLVGLIPKNSEKEEVFIGEIEDLTNIVIRYWCNALYLIKQIHSVVIILDTSFIDPSKEKSGLIAHSRSKRPVMMTEECGIDLPDLIRNRAVWYNSGKSLDGEVIRMTERLNETPFYFSPNKLWSNKHIVYQASRDNELAFENLFTETKNSMETEIMVYTTKEGQYEGYFTRHLRQVLSNYFDENPIPTETYPMVMKRVELYCGSDLPQHPVYFVGESRKYETFISGFDIPQSYSTTTVEACSDNQIIVTPGFVGIKDTLEFMKSQVTEDGFTEINNSNPVVVAKVVGEETSDPYITVLDVDESNPISSIFTVGKSIQLLPITDNLVRVAVPNKTSTEDPELKLIATSICGHLKQKGYCSKDFEVYEKVYSTGLWNNVLFDKHIWGLSNKINYDSLIRFIKSVEKTPFEEYDWETIKVQIKCFIAGLHVKIYNEIQRDTANKISMSFPDLNGVPKIIGNATEKDYVEVLYKLRSWLLYRSDDMQYTETSDRTNIWCCMRIINDLIRIGKKVCNLQGTEVVVCRNVINQPIHGFEMIKRTIPYSERLILPISEMTFSILSFEHGEISKHTTPSGNFLDVDPEILGSTIEESKMGSIITNFWCNYYSLVLGSKHSGLVLDTSELISRLTPVGHAEMCDLMQIYNLNAIRNAKSNPETAKESIEWVSRFAGDKLSVSLELLTNQLVIESLQKIVNDNRCLEIIRKLLFEKTLPRKTVNALVFALFKIAELFGENIKEWIDIVSNVIKLYFAEFWSSEKKLEPIEKVTQHITLGLLLESSGCYSEALSYYKRSLELCDELKFPAIPSKYNDYIPYNPSGLAKGIKTAVLRNIVVCKSSVCGNISRTLGAKVASEMISSGKMSQNTLDFAHYKSYYDESNLGMYDYILEKVCESQIEQPFIKLISLFRKEICNTTFKTPNHYRELFQNICLTPPNYFQNTNYSQNTNLSTLLIGVILPSYYAVDDSIFNLSISPEKFDLPIDQDTLQETSKIWWGCDDVLGSVLGGMLLTGLSAGLYKNFDLASQLFREVFSTEEVDKKIISLGGELLAWSTESSKFFISSSPEFDDQIRPQDEKIGATSYLCPPVEWIYLPEIIKKWYWREWKLKLFAERKFKNLPLCRNKDVVPLGLKEDTVNISSDIKDPINLSISLITKIATSVRRSYSIELHDSERIELNVNHNRDTTIYDLEYFKKRLYEERKDTTHPKIRYRFHVLDFQSTGNIKLLTNYSGHSINIPFHTVDDATTIRLGATTSKHEGLEKYFTNSVYRLCPPLTHLIISMVIEKNELIPSMFDVRFFEQTPDLDLSSRYKRILIKHTYQQLESQKTSRLIKTSAAENGLLDGDSFFTEWIRIKTIPTPNIPQKLISPSSELASLFKLSDSYPNSVLSVQGINRNMFDFDMWVNPSIFGFDKSGKVLEKHQIVDTRKHQKDNKFAYLDPDNLDFDLIMKTTNLPKPKELVADDLYTRIVRLLKAVAIEYDLSEGVATVYSSKNTTQHALGITKTILDFMLRNPSQYTEVLYLGLIEVLGIIPGDVIIVIPKTSKDQDILRVPFAMLKKKDGSFLIDTHFISYQKGWKELCTSMVTHYKSHFKPKPARTSILCIGSPQNSVRSMELWGNDCTFISENAMINNFLFQSNTHVLIAHINSDKLQVINDKLRSVATSFVIQATWNPVYVLTDQLHIKTVLLPISKWSDESSLSELFERYHDLLRVGYNKMSTTKSEVNFGDLMKENGPMGCLRGLQLAVRGGMSSTEFMNTSAIWSNLALFGYPYSDGDHAHLSSEELKEREKFIQDYQ